MLEEKAKQLKSEYHDMKKERKRSKKGLQKITQDAPVSEPLAEMEPLMSQVTNLKTEVSPPPEVKVIYINYYLNNILLVSFYDILTAT